MIIYKYKDLSDKAQEFARGDYLLGWMESHDNGDEISMDDIHSILLKDLIDYEYTIDGVLLSIGEDYE